MDFVYIVKESDKNDDLKYSLRSIAKFYPDRKVWLVGYKPKWAQNVNYLPVKQTSTKWANSVNNIIAACKCPDISEDFILMNDDFFILKEKYPLEEVCNMNLGNLDEAIKIYAKKTTRWCKAFKQVKELLQDLKVEGPYYNYEAHLPISINKTKYLEIMNLPQVKAFIKTDKVLHKRTLYKNLIGIHGKSINPDVKLKREMDDTVMRLSICGWVSVYDNQVGNSRFPKLNFVLNDNFPEPCIYESSKSNPANLHNLIDYTPKKRYSPIKRSKDFIHY